MNYKVLQKLELSLDISGSIIFTSILNRLIRQKLAQAEGQDKMLPSSVIMKRLKAEKGYWGYKMLK